MPKKQEIDKNETVRKECAIKLQNGGRIRTSHGFYKLISTEKSNHHITDSGSHISRLKLQGDTILIPGRANGELASIIACLKHLESQGAVMYDYKQTQPDEPEETKPKRKKRGIRFE